MTLVNKNMTLSFHLPLELEMKRTHNESQSVMRQDIVTQEYFDYRERSNIYKTDYVIKASYTLSEKERGRECPVPIFAQDKTKKECLDYMKFNGIVPSDTTGITGGKKKFTTSSYQYFQKMYLNMKRGTRLFYETILPDIPCHLYLDVEMYYSTNGNVDTKKILNTFENEILNLLFKLELIEGQDDFEFITLDSSSSKKLSKHYIIKLKGRCFRNNYHCGAFMRRFHNYMIEKYGMIKDNPFFFWDDKETQFQYNPVKHNKVFLGDMGVYTSARQFRLYGSSKELAPDRILLLEGQEENDVIPERFIDTLIQRVLPGTKIIDCLEDGSHMNETQPQSTSDRRFFMCNSRYGTTQGGSKKQKNLDFPLQTLKGESPRLDFSSTDIVRSEFPLVCSTIMDFIQTKLKDGNVEKCDLFFPKTKILCLSTRSHYCLIRGDYHKSNHIYFIVNFYKKIYYQKCHDDDCNGRSIIQKIDDQRTLDEIDKYLRSQTVDLKDPLNVDDFISFGKFVLSSCISKFRGTEKNDLF